MKLTYLQDRNRIIDVTNKLIVTKEGKEGKIHFGIGIDIYSSVLFSCSVMSDSATPWTAAFRASLSITNS